MSNINIEQNPTNKVRNESFIPRPPTHYLTDTKIKRIFLVLLPILLLAIPCLVAIASVGSTKAIILGGMIGGMLSIIGLHISWYNWPKVDFQTEKGAIKVRKDLRSKKLCSLAWKYSFNDLRYYKYISPQNAKSMQSLYDSLPRTDFVRRGNDVDWYATHLVNKANGTYKSRRGIQDKFDNLRSQHNFIL